MEAIIDIPANKKTTIDLIKKCFVAKECLKGTTTTV